MMHAGRIETSNRLKGVLAFLAGRGQRGATTIEIADALRTTNPGRDVSEINHNFRRSGIGRKIVCEYEGATDSGRRIWRYRLLEEMAA